MISIRVWGEDELRDVAQRLRRGPHHLRRELTAGLRDAARPAVADVKQAIRTADVSGRRTGKQPPFRAHMPSRGLRAPMARAVEADISSGGADPRVVIRMREGSIPVRIRMLVKYVAGSAQRWRHPIMGHRGGRWASQNAPNVWWKTLRRHLPRFRREVDQAVASTSRQLEG